MSATTTPETVNQTATAPAADANGASTAGEAAVAKKELQGHRIHIGNLPFKATEEEVRALASKADVEILEVVIPQRFGRPAGYAFVALKTEDDAKKVLEALADEEIEGRKIKLQVARSPEEQAERRAEVTEKRKADKEAAKAEKAKLAAEKKAAEASDAAAAEGTGEAGAVKPKKKRASKKGPRRRVPGDEDEEAEAEGEATDAPAADATAPTANGEAKAAKPKKKKSTKSKKAREARIDGGAATEGEEAAAPATTTDAAQVKEPKEKKEKKAKKPRQVPTGEPSPNTVFVANLPFEVDDAALAAIFTDLSIRVTSAKVVTGVRRNREGRTFRGSRGFGFVEVEDASQQKEAVEKVEGTVIGDRTLSAKIANEMKEAEVEEAARDAQKGDAAAAATGSPAAVSADAA